MVQKSFISEKTTLPQKPCSPEPSCHMATRRVPAKVLQNVFLWLRQAVELKDLERNHSSGNGTAEGRRKNPPRGLAWLFGGSQEKSEQDFELRWAAPSLLARLGIVPAHPAWGSCPPCTCRLGPVPVHAPVGSRPRAGASGMQGCRLSSGRGGSLRGKKKGRNCCRQDGRSHFCKPGP